MIKAEPCLISVPSLQMQAGRPARAGGAEAIDSSSSVRMSAKSAVPARLTLLEGLYETRFAGLLLGSSWKGTDGILSQAKITKGSWSWSGSKSMISNLFTKAFM